MKADDFRENEIFEICNFGDHILALGTADNSLINTLLVIPRFPKTLAKNFALVGMPVLAFLFNLQLMMFCFI